MSDESEDQCVLDESEKVKKLKFWLERLKGPLPVRSTLSPTRDSSNWHVSEPPSPPINDESNDHHHPNEKSLSVIFWSIKNVPHNPQIDPAVNACFNCRKVGHTYKICRQPKLYDFCCNCGRRHVQVHNCPRCYKAHVEFEERRRPVEPMPPFRSRVRNSEYDSRDKRRARSSARNPDAESRDYRRDKSRRRAKSVGRSRGTDSSRGDVYRNNGETRVAHEWEMRRSPVTREKNMSRETKSNPVAKNLTWCDLEDTRENRNPIKKTYYSRVFYPLQTKRQDSNADAAEKNLVDCQDQHEANSYGGAYAQDDIYYDSEFDDKVGIDEDFCSLMKEMEHLPEETQNAARRRIMQERRASMKRDRPWK